MARPVDQIDPPPSKRRGRRPPTATVDAGAGAPRPTPAAAALPVVDAAPRAPRVAIAIEAAWSRAATNAIAQIDLQIVGRISRARPELLEKVAWTDRELALIEPSIAKILGKYGGALLANWGDEISLFLLLSTITQAKLAGLKNLMELERRAAAAADPSRVTAFPEHAPGGAAASS